MGGISFAVTYSNYDWWFETGFYGGLITGIIIEIISFVGLKNKE